jgi:hypothetical protein
VGLAGCLANDGSSASDEPENGGEGGGNGTDKNNNESSANDESKDEGEEGNNGTDETNDFEPDIEEKIKLGQADPVSTEAEPEREYEYLEEDDAVLIEYNTGRTNRMPFDEWGTRRAVAAGADYIQQRLEQKEWGSEISFARGVVELTDLEGDVDESEFDRDIRLGIKLNYYIGYSRDGEKQFEPEVDFSKVVDATPRKIEVTMLFPEQEYTAVLPVICRRNVSQEE